MSKRKPRAGIKKGARAWYNGIPIKVVSTHHNGTSDISYTVWSASTWGKPVNAGSPRLDILT